MTDMKTLNRLSMFAACMLLGMPLAGQAAENPRFEMQGTETVAGTPLPDAELIFGLTTTNRIISFAPGAPNVLLSNVQILGLGIGENVHQVADRCTLIAADIAHAGFQKRLGDGKDAFAGEGLAGPQLEIFHLRLEAAFGHVRSRACGC